MNTLHQICHSPHWVHIGYLSRNERLFFSATTRLGYAPYKIIIGIEDSALTGTSTFRTYHGVSAFERVMDYLSEYTSLKESVIYG